MEEQELELLFGYSYHLGTLDLLVSAIHELAYAHIVTDFVVVLL